MKYLKLFKIGFIVAIILSLGLSTNILYADSVSKTVKSIKVLDIPHDEGSGLQIQWEPLPKESRIISYRVYRGTTKDTLFFIGEIPVNVKTGVSSPTMSFYDKDWTEFLDLRSPGKLKKEKHLSPKLPFYQKIPKDMSIVGPMLSQYSILGVIPKDEFYYKTKKIELTEKNEKVIYAGLKSNQITLVKKLIPEKEYYYTIVAVDEKRNFYPAEKIVKGKAIDNAPSTPVDVYATYVKDTGTLNFEWGHPVFYDDLNNYSIYVIPNGLAAPIKIYDIKTPQPYTAPDYAVLKLTDNKVMSKTGEVLFDFNKVPVENCKFIVSFSDYSAFESKSELFGAEVITRSMLPVIPRLQISDKINDKGDYNTLSWGKPVAYINSVQIINDRKIQLSYDFVTNKYYKVNHIYFEIYDANNQLISKKNEFYQDKIFKLKLNNTLKDQKELHIKMYFKYNGKLDNEYVLEQKLIYDPIILTMRPGKVSVANNTLEDFSFLLMKAPVSTELFRVIKRVSGIEREADDKVNYEASIFKGVSKFDLKNNVFLVDTNIDVAWDRKGKSTINTSIYSVEKNKQADKIKKNIAQIDSLINKSVNPDEKAMYATYLTKYKNDLAALESSEILKDINKENNDKKRMKMIAALREVDKRLFNYFMIMSNGKAYIIEDSLNMENGERTYVFPIPNWFNTDKTATLFASLLFGLLVFIYVTLARKGKDLYIRPIAGIDEIDNAIGRATEMGRPILFCPGLSGIGDVATLAGLSILGRIAKKAAEYDTRILVPCRDYIVIPIAQEIVREAHYEAGRPDSFEKNNVFFVSDQQFAYVAGVNGVMLREKTATNFYMGMFYAESLIMTETGNTTGAIQIAGTDAVTQIPFFITTCDYTLIGEELYAASAYLARQPLMLGTLKAQDFAKFFILLFMVLGTLLSSFQITTIIKLFPNK